MTKRSNLLVPALFLVACLGFLAARLGSTPALRTAPAPRTVLVRPVHLEDGFPLSREYLGRLEAPRVSALGFERGGTLVQVSVDEGARVLAGDPLARLDDQELVAEESRLVALVEASRARLEELRAGPRMQTLRAARARVRAARAAAALATREETRQRDLGARQATTDQARDQARFRADQAQGALAEAEAVLEELEAGTRAEILASQLAAVRAAEAALARLRVDLGKSRLRAPFPGVVLERHADEGQVLAPGSPVLTLQEEAPPEVRLGLPPEEAARLLLGEATEVRIRETTWPARVRNVLPEVRSPTHTRTVILVLSPGAPAVPGELVTWRRTRIQPTPGTWLPRDALQEGHRGLWACWVVVSDPEGVPRIRRAPLELLHLAGDRVFVRGALEEGSLVVTRGAHRVVPGDPATPRLADSAGARPGDPGGTHPGSSLPSSPENRGGPRP